MISRPQQMANVRRLTPAADLPKQIATLQEIWRREDAEKAKQQKQSEDRKFRASMTSAASALAGNTPILSDFVQGMQEGNTIADFLENWQNRKEKANQPPMPALKAYPPGASQQAQQQTVVKQRRAKAARTRKAGRNPAPLPLIGGLPKPRLPKVSPQNAQRRQQLNKRFGRRQKQVPSLAPKPPVGKLVPSTSKNAPRTRGTRAPAATTGFGGDSETNKALVKAMEKLTESLDKTDETQQKLAREFPKLFGKQGGSSIGRAAAYNGPEKVVETRPNPQRPPRNASQPTVPTGRPVINPPT